MINYKVTNLTHSTPKSEQAKLETNLKAMAGVHKVNLQPNTSQVSLSFHDKKEPAKSVIDSAVSSAGFKLGARN